ncbi:MAG: peptidylprolyl isomerase [Porticoccaceae bacterium]|nr:peptidylprolyl isomerase [Porticoccaceae bacterium]
MHYSSALHSPRHVSTLHVSAPHSSAPQAATVRKPIQSLRRGLSLLTATIAITLTPALLATPSYAEVQLIDGIAAVVNEDVVLISELRSEVNVIHQRLLSSEGKAPPPQEIASQVLDKLILDKLQLAIGEQAGVKIDDGELNEALRGIAERQKMTMDELVAQVHQEGMTLNQLRKQVSNEMVISRVQRAMVNRRITVSEQEVSNFLNSDQGQLLGSPDLRVGHILLLLSPAASEAEIKEALDKVQGLRDQLAQGEEFSQLAILHSAGQNALKGGNLGWRKASQLPAPFTEVLAKLAPGEVGEPIRSDAGLHLLKLYERRDGDQKMIQQNRVRHILLTPNQILNEEQAQALAVELRARLSAGEDFAELAREYSDDTGTALKGGDLGWSTPGQFVPKFQLTMEATATGQISEPFRSQFGWHVLQVTERRNQDFSKEIRSNQASSFLRQSKFEEELQIWLQEIRDEAFIDIRV